MARATPPAGNSNAASPPDARDTERHPPLAHFLSSLNQSILQTLMVSLAMVVAEVGMDGSAQHVLAKENHPTQALFLQAPPKSLQLSIEIGRMRRQANRLDSGVPENSAKAFTELGVPVHEEIALPQ